MKRYDRKTQVLAGCLSAVAGFVDAAGFLQLGGLFVSFMSGNSTRLGVGLVREPALAAVAAGLIAFFVIGVIVGSLAGHFAGWRRLSVVLITVAMLLAAAVGLHAVGATALALMVTAAAMGAENAAFQKDGEVSIGLTYMTGALVKFAQSLTQALLGGPRYDWVAYLGLWAGLVSGAVLGALTYGRYGLTSLLFAVSALLILAAFARVSEHHD